MKKILVIDDEREMVELTRFRLQANGYEVITAVNGIEGLNLAQEEKPDLITVDIMMPKLDGVGFIQEIKRLPDLKSTPIIVITGRDNLHNFLKEEGVNAYLTKPLDIDEFLELVKSLTKS